MEEKSVFKYYIERDLYLAIIQYRKNTLLDKDLAYIDPHDPNLNTFMKSKVLRECKSNLGYFVREVVRIPDKGGSGGDIL